MNFFDALEGAVYAAVAESVERSTELVASRAIEKAPFRKIFRGVRRTMRFKSIQEVEGDRALRSAIGLGPERAAPPGMTHPSRHPAYGRVVTGVNQRYFMFDHRTLKGGRPGHLESELGESLLSRRGRYEVRSRRSEHEGEAGGRLRAGIHSTPVRITGRKIEGSVISTAPYSKFQELGTRHNPAHPFLRPALEESREEIVTDALDSAVTAGREIARSFRGLGPAVKVLLKAEVG